MQIWQATAKSVHSTRYRVVRGPKNGANMCNNNEICTQHTVTRKVQICKIVTRSTHSTRLPRSSGAREWCKYVKTMTRSAHSPRLPRRSGAQEWCKYGKQCRNLHTARGYRVVRAPRMVQICKTITKSAHSTRLPRSSGAQEWCNMRNNDEICTQHAVTA